MLIVNLRMLENIAKWSDFLLSHYTKTFADRSVYWTARERSKTHQDLLTMAVDSYDKGKVTLPRWPFQRTPKKAIFESTHRNLTAYSIFSRVLDGDIYFHDGPVSKVQVLPSLGASYTGYGVFLYLSDEGMAGGANWTIEVAPLQQLPHTPRLPNGLQ